MSGTRHSNPTMPWLSTAFLEETPTSLDNSDGFLHPQALERLAANQVLDIGNLSAFHPDSNSKSR